MTNKEPIYDNIQSNSIFHENSISTTLRLKWSHIDKINGFLKKHGVNTKPKAWWIYALLVSMAGYGCYVEKINQYVAIHYGEYLQKAYNALVNHGWLNFLFFVGIVAVAFIVGDKIRKDKLFSWKRLLIELFFLFILLYQNQWDYAKCFLDFDYRTLLIIINLALIILEVEKYRFHKAPEPTQNRIYRRYIADNDFNPEQDYQRRETLAKEIVDRALATDISKESFSVGITGGWGTGKTTMLGNIKNAIGDRAYVVEFNPWNSQTPSQIITDFFSEIRSRLSSDYRTLTKPIMRYAKLLTDVKLNPVENWLVSRLNNYAEKDLSGCKELVGEQLKKLDRPLVVLIDDSDRLEGDEMFEVLRLVRNTAKLPNIIYFVTFDKCFLVGQLNQKKVPEAAQYVEKIFPLEIAMPYAEKHLLISALYYDINQMMKNENLTNWIYRHISNADLMNAVEILGSYRQVKRFARLYTTEMSYMKNVFKKMELDVTDLFWLTIIQLTDNEAYEIMFRSPEYYFNIERSSTNAYMLKDDADNIEGLATNTKNILTKLFTKNGGNINNSIRFCDNYYNYFYMGLEKGRVSLQEIEDLIKASDDVDSKMAELCKQKSSQSLYHRLSGYQMQESLEGYKAYFAVLTAWMNCQQHQLMAFLFTGRLTPDRIKEEYRTVFIAWFIKRMKTVIQTTDNFIQVAKVLTKLYPVYPSDWEEEQVEITHIIEKEDILELSKLTFNCCLKKYSDSDAMDIMDSKTYLGKLYKVFTIEVDYSSYVDESRMENLVIDEAITYFSQHKSQRYKECNDYFQLTEKEKRLNYADEMKQAKEDEKTALFGSDTMKYEKFLDQCFVHPNGQDANQNTTEKKEE